MGYIQHGVKWLSLLNKAIYLRAPQKRAIGFPRKAVLCTVV
jgi:hypothetical protein